MNTNHANNKSIKLADSITKLESEFRGTVLVCGSHGGRYCGYLAAVSGLRGVVLNDAGVGKNRAGIAALPYLQKLGLPAATVSCYTARIGDGSDIMERGLISHCNSTAIALGCFPGYTSLQAAETMLEGQIFEGEPPHYEESRTVIRELPVPVLACDSASLVKPTDAGAIIVTGSHGGILAGRPNYGIGAKARGAVFNDAGIGIDQAGIQRLKVLDEVSIPAVVVDSNTARIGDARSAWESGVISHVNSQAVNRGITVGMTIPVFADLLSS